MKLWIVSRPADDVEWDDVIDFAVLAADEDGARDVALLASGAFAEAFADDEPVTVEEVPTDVPGVVLAHVKYG